MGLGDGIETRDDRAGVSVRKGPGEIIVHRRRDFSRDFRFCSRGMGSRIAISPLIIEVGK